MITYPPEHLIDAAIKAATVVTRSSGGSGNAALYANAANAGQFGSSHANPPTACSSTETIVTTKYLDRARAIEVVKAVLRAVADGRV